ncbi:Uncharacterised protein [Bacillus freudenreichii]|nr:Uncharacterised protein [Bacillus freudenreichii]
MTRVRERTQLICYPESTCSRNSGTNPIGNLLFGQHKPKIIKYFLVRLLLEAVYFISNIISACGIPSSKYTSDTAVNPNEA